MLNPREHASRFCTFAAIRPGQAKDAFLYGYGTEESAKSLKLHQLGYSKFSLVDPVWFPLQRQEDESLPVPAI